MLRIPVAFAVLLRASPALAEAVGERSHGAVTLEYLRNPAAVACPGPDQANVKQIADRFTGLEIENPGVTSIHTGKGIKGINWLTVIGDPWVQMIGGLDYLGVRFGGDFELTPYDGGLMIEAGPKPQIGDVVANRWPMHYVTLAKVLKPVQIKDHYPFHVGDSLGPARMDHQAAKAWIYRFDGR